MRMAHSGKGSQHVFQSPQMAGMIQGAGLRCLMTVLRDFQDGQDPIQRPSPYWVLRIWVLPGRIPAPARHRSGLGARSRR